MSQELQKTFTVNLTDIQAKAMHYFAYDPQEWIETAVFARCQVAMDEIFNNEIQRLMNDPNTTSIPANRQDVILNALVKTAKERSDETLSTLQQQMNSGS
jgi:hypothetical protein